MTRKHTYNLRSLQRYIHFKKRNITFKTSHLSPGSKIALFWSFICFISLFLPWMSSFSGINQGGVNNIDSFGSFSSILWYIWFFILILLWIIFFLLFSTSKKEKVRYIIMLQFSENLMCLWWALMIFLLCLHSFFFISWLELFSSGILYGKWIILCITGSIVLLIGSIIMRTEYRKNIKWSYISELYPRQDSTQNTTEKSNMKLPF